MTGGMAYEDRDREESEGVRRDIAQIVRHSKGTLHRHIKVSAGVYADNSCILKRRHGRFDRPPFLYRKILFCGNILLYIDK